MVQLTGSYLTYPAFYIGALLVSILPSYLKNQKNPNYLSPVRPGRCRRCCSPSS